VVANAGPLGAMPASVVISLPALGTIFLRPEVG
jgi:hypothetical protein